jgi:hypothetical protein
VIYGLLGAMPLRAHAEQSPEAVFERLLGQKPRTGLELARVPLGGPLALQQARVELAMGTIVAKGTFSFGEVRLCEGLLRVSAGATVVDCAIDAGLLKSVPLRGNLDPLVLVGRASVQLPGVSSKAEIEARLSTDGLQAGLSVGSEHVEIGPVKSLTELLEAIPKQAGRFAVGVAKAAALTGLRAFFKQVFGIDPPDKDGIEIPIPGVYPLGPTPIVLRGLRVVVARDLVSVVAPMTIAGVPYCDVTLKIRKEGIELSCQASLGVLHADLHGSLDFDFRHWELHGESRQSILGFDLQKALVHIDEDGVRIEGAWPLTPLLKVKLNGSSDHALRDLVLRGGFEIKVFGFGVGAAIEIRPSAVYADLDLFGAHQRLGPLVPAFAHKAIQKAAELIAKPFKLVWEGVKEAVHFVGKAAKEVGRQVAKAAAAVASVVGDVAVKAFEGLKQGAEAVLNCARAVFDAAKGAAETVGRVVGRIVEGLGNLACGLDPTGGCQRRRRDRERERQRAEAEQRLRQQEAEEKERELEKAQRRHDALALLARHGVKAFWACVRGEEGPVTSEVRVISQVTRSRKDPRASCWAMISDLGPDLQRVGNEERIREELRRALQRQHDRLEAQRRAREEELARAKREESALRALKRYGADKLRHCASEGRPCFSQPAIRLPACLAKVIKQCGADPIAWDSLPFGLRQDLERRRKRAETALAALDRFGPGRLEACAEAGKKCPIPFLCRLSSAERTRFFRGLPPGIAQTRIVAATAGCAASAACVPIQARACGKESPEAWGDLAPALRWKLQQRVRRARAALQRLGPATLERCANEAAPCRRAKAAQRATCERRVTVQCGADPNLWGDLPSELQEQASKL